MMNMKCLEHDDHSLVKINHFFCHFHFVEGENRLREIRNLFSLPINCINGKLNPGPFDSRTSSWQATAGGPNVAHCLLFFCK